MAAMRPELSIKNKYWIDKHRHYELKHFCLQYPEWKKEYSKLESMSIHISTIDRFPNSNLPSDPTARKAIMKAIYLQKMRLIEKVAIEADSFLQSYILKGVTEGLSYTYLRTNFGMPCGKDMYYDRYRKFFWLLDKYRD